MVSYTFFGLMRIMVVNIQSQMASALAVEADYPGSLEAIEHGKVAAEGTGSPELKVFFAASELHIHLLHWDDSQVVHSAVQRCAGLWEEIPTYQVGVIAHLISLIGLGVQQGRS